MEENFVLDGITVVYDSERLPFECESSRGVRLIHPALTYGQRLAAYAEIRQTAARLLCEIESGQYDKFSI